VVTAREVVARVVDPEMPMLTLDDLGVVRDVTTEGDAVTVTITPTYSGCPAVEEMRTDLADALRAAGFGPVRVRTVFAPAWSTDWISEAGRRKLAAAGVAPPGSAPRPSAGPVPLTLTVPTSVFRKCWTKCSTSSSRSTPMTNSLISLFFMPRAAMAMPAMT